MIIQVCRNFYLNRLTSILNNIIISPKSSLITTRLSFQITQQLKKKDNSIENYLTHEKSINILKVKGINQFFPIQALTFQHIAQGKNVIGGDKTGSGKTIAFSLPIIERLRKQSFDKNTGIKFVILAPTRQLAIQISQQIQELRHFRQQFDIVTVYGGVPVSMNQKRLRYNPDIVVGTPGRIKDLIQRGLLNFQNVQVVCIDQADYMFDIGFEEDVDLIMQNIRNNSKNTCQYLCFSATLNKKVITFTDKYMGKNRIVVRNNQTTIFPENINHCFVKVQSSIEDKIPIINYLIQNQSNNGRVIIFTNTKRQANQISKNLSTSNVVLHGDIEQRKRLQRLNLFKKGQSKIMIASDVAARGLDITNVQLVINYQLPNNTQQYIHRSGRTGRAGKNGLCISLISNIRQLADIQKILKKKIKQISVQEQKILSYKKSDVQGQVQEKEKENIQAEKKQEQNIIKSDVNLILFDKRDKLTKKQILDILKQQKIQFFRLNQVFLQHKGQKFFTLFCKDAENAQRALEIEIKSEDNRPFYFHYKIIKKT